MLKGEKEDEKANDGHKPSTSSAISVDWHQKLQESHEELLERARTKFEELKSLRRCFVKALEPLRTAKEAFLSLGPIKRSLEWNRGGWRRVGDIYRQEMPESFEWRMLKYAFNVSAIMGVLLGGLQSMPESARRFDVYAGAKDFGTVGYLRQRKMDFILNRFYLNGFRKGIWLASSICLILAVTLGVTAFRDRYSPFYFPLVTASVFSTIAFTRGVGIIGLGTAIIVSTVPSFLVTAGTLGCCLYTGLSADEGYKRLREMHRVDALREIEEEVELARFMESTGMNSGFKPWGRYKMRKVKEDGAWKRETKIEDDNELLRFGENSAE